MDDDVLMEKIVSKVKEMRSELEGDSGGLRRLAKMEVITKLIGVSVPTELTINSPAYVHTKGFGKRIKGGRELTIEKSECSQKDFWVL